MGKLTCKHRGLWIAFVVVTLVLTSWYAIQVTLNNEVWKKGASIMQESSTRPETNVRLAAFTPMEQGMKPYSGGDVHLAITVCGERLEQAMVMLKSVVIFTKTRIQVHAFVEDKLQRVMERQIDAWPALYRQSINLHIYNNSFPDVVCKGCQIDIWKKLFHPCAAQRLFFPSLLPHVDSVLHIDTDTLVLRPIEDLWSFFTTFNSTQSLGATMCRGQGEDPKTSTIVIDHYVPYYGDSGLNSGVLLLNLTRLRSSTWAPSMDHLIIHYGMKQRIGDQDFINAYGAAHPDEVYVLPYEWDYIRAQERPQDVNGNVSILHATSSRFHLDICLGMKAMYSAFKAFELGKDDVSILIPQMEGFQKIKKKCEFKLVPTNR